MHPEHEVVSLLNNRKAIHAAYDGVKATGVKVRQVV